MKVLHTPYGRENPYQDMLIASLKQNNVEVYTGNVCSYFSLIKAVRNQVRPDVIHLHWAHLFILADTRMKTIIKSVSFLFELLALRLCGIKIVWTIHNLVSHESPFPELEMAVNRSICLLCNRLIVHSISAKNEIIAKYKITMVSSIRVIAHGNYIGYYENKINQNEAREQLGLQPDDRVFLYFGAIRSYKGVPDLIDAFNKLATKASTGKRAKLLIVGAPYDDKIYKETITTIGDNDGILAVLRYIDDKEVQIYMNATDIVVLPFKRLLTTSSAILAMSFGKPVVAPLIGSIPDILDSKGGFLYAITQRDGLLNAMRQALRNRAE